MAKIFEVTIDGKKIEQQGPLTLEQIKNSVAGADNCIMAANVNGKLTELTEIVNEHCKIEFLDAKKDEEASRIYLRGLIFLLLRAIKNTMGDVRLNTEYILNGGVYCTLDSLASVPPENIRSLEAEMTEYIKEDLPFNYKRTSTDRAIQYFTEIGETDKVHLLGFRPFNYFNIYEYDGIKNYFYGIMPPSASYLSGFTLKPFDKGFIMSFPAPYRVGDKAHEEQPKLAKVFADAEKWAQILEVSKVADLNELVKNKGLREFIRINEALHEEKLSELAEIICAREKVRMVLIAGPSSSGKTTFANRLKIHLRVHGKKCYPISIDDYYLERGNIPTAENGKADLENITAIDTARFNQDLISLLNGEETVLAKYNFLTGKREDGQKIKIGPDDLLIIEGIHGLNDKLTMDIGAKYKFKIFICPLSPLNLDCQNVVFPEDIRLLRRLVRDKLTRGYSFLDTLNVWESVREGEFKYILPYMENADIMFNSSLLYEAAILKKYAYQELNDLKQKNIRANYLVKFLNYFLSCEDDDEIPRNSIMREFIGSSCFF